MQGLGVLPDGTLTRAEPFELVALIWGQHGLAILWELVNTAPYVLELFNGVGGLALQSFVRCAESGGTPLQPGKLLLGCFKLFQRLRELMRAQMFA